MLALNHSTYKNKTLLTPQNVQKQLMPGGLVKVSNVANNVVASCQHLSARVRKVFLSLPPPLLILLRRYQMVIFEANTIQECFIFLRKKYAPHINLFTQALTLRNYRRPLPYCKPNGNLAIGNSLRGKLLKKCYSYIS